MPTSNQLMTINKKQTGESAFKLLTRVLVVSCCLLVSQPGLTEWNAVNTKVLGNRALLQKEISANKGQPIIAIVCIPEPTLIVEWVRKHSSIAINIDSVDLDVPDQVAMRNGMQAITLKPGHLKALISGLEMQISATLPSGEEITAETSLRGFTAEFEKANMDCST